MRGITAKAAIILADSRQFNTADLALVLGEDESEIVQVVSALKTIRREIAENPLPHESRSPLTFCDTHDVLLRCPHCGENTMDEATVSLGALVEAWPLYRFIEVYDDGYARPGGLELTCPDCKRLSLLRLTDDLVILVAARTEKDLRLIGEAEL